MTADECQPVNVNAPRTYYYGQTPQNPRMDFVGFGRSETPAEECIYQTRATGEEENAEP